MDKRSMLFFMFVNLRYEYVHSLIFSFEGKGQSEQNRQNHFDRKSFPQFVDKISAHQYMYL